MAQNFRRYTLSQVGTVAADIPDGANFDTYDTIVGIMLANVTSNAITVSLLKMRLLRLAVRCKF